MKIKAMLRTLRYFTAGLIVGWPAFVQAATPAAPMVARKPSIVFVPADGLGMSHGTASIAIHDLTARAGELFESEHREVPEWPTTGR